MEVGQDTLPELQRIFTFLNSHSNKLYQEGYFLKFHDTDARMSRTSTTLSRNTDMMQVAALPQIENGRSTLSNSWAPSSHCGMQANWIRPAVMLKYSQPSST
jgi:hypothetical protein